jgi:outer membrane protein assembly factor BamB
MEHLARNCYAWKYPTPHLSGSIDFVSPVLVDGKVLYYGWGNRMTVLEAATGKVLAQQTTGRSAVKALSGGVTKNWAYGGMIRAGDQLVLVHDNGLVRIFPINDTFSPMPSCALPDDIYAQPTCNGPALYFRTLHALYRFDAPHPQAAAQKESAPKEKR